ncbi:hypothetical protein [Knoellia koreensis]|uniref:Uncharacterized protein n=1 Tax=Knoellia koreensis TaxID=2730921 RepID=A0A849HCN0_9MICO|nr:hypothetical protein [Knoellia sp. DB2414S]NNM44444.1 hypothetical protein [Knoellia sp. DB2414S]
MHPSLAMLRGIVESHAADRGYRVVDAGLDRDGYLAIELGLPGRDGNAHVTLNGEVFVVSFEGGYSWTEFAYDEEDRRDVLDAVLGLVDSYADPRSVEVTVRRRWRRARKELRLTNGAVLRTRGWSQGPTG